MRIRKTIEQDVPDIMKLYEYARHFMAEHGNPNQWGPTSWPPEWLIQEDVNAGNSYVCLNDDGQVIGTFFFAYGKDIEPTYRVITNGTWRDDSPFGVIHRLAGNGTEKGIGAFCLDWAYDQCGHLKIDTHGDNIVMQRLLAKLGFERRGIIYVEEDEYPRIAYEK